MSKQKILFIDDEQFIREMMYEMLTEMDYEVDVEATGEEAIRTFSQRPYEFDLVLTDLMRLDITGDEIAKRIRSVRDDVPIIVITGTPDSLPYNRARTIGVCKVLGKPLTKAELLGEIRGILSHHC